MANDKTYIADAEELLHRATRTFVPTPTEVKFSSNVNDYKVQILVDGKWHSAVLTYTMENPTLFNDPNIDKAFVEDENSKKHTAMLVAIQSGEVALSPIPTDIYGTVAGTTTGEVAMATYEEEWAEVKFENNINVNKALVKGSDGKFHTALIVASISVL